MQPAEIAIARSSPLFRHLSDRTAEALLASAQVRCHAKGSTIFLQGERATALRIVLDGWVKLYRIAPSGSEAILQLLPRRRSFEELPAMCGSNHRVSAQATCDCAVLQIRTEAIRRAMEEDPEVAVAILYATALHVDDMFDHVEQLKVRNGAQRLAEFLTTHCSRQQGYCEVRLPYGKSLIAGRLGMKPESLSRAFTRLKPLGVTVRSGMATIEDVGRLRDFAQEDPALSWT